MYQSAEGVCQVGDFIDQSPEADQRKILVTLGHIDVHRGLVKNKEKFKVLEGQKGGGRDQFYEVKVHQIRIASVFEPGGRLILLYAFKKKGEAWPKRELEKLHHVYNTFDAERRR